MRVELVQSVCTHAGYTASRRDEERERASARARTRRTTSRGSSSTRPSGRACSTDTVAVTCARSRASTPKSRSSGTRRAARRASTRGPRGPHGPIALVFETKAPTSTSRRGCAISAEGSASRRSRHRRGALDRRVPMLHCRRARPHDHVVVRRLRPRRPARRGQQGSALEESHVVVVCSDGCMEHIAPSYASRRSPGTFKRACAPNAAACSRCSRTTSPRARSSPWRECAAP